MGTPARRLPVALLVCALAASVGSVAWTQPGTVFVDQPAGIMRLLVAVPGTGTTNDPASRFQLRTLTGDPTTLNDDNRIVASVISPFGSDAAAFSSITTISIDNSNTAATNQVLADLSSLQDGGGPAFWPLAPTVGLRDILYKMLVPIDNADPTVALERIQVDQDAVLLRDTLKLDFTLTNRGTTAHTVGLRAFIDSTFGSTLRDGTSIILSDGTVVTNESVFPGATSSQLPDGWVSFDSTSSPAVILRGTLTGGEVSDAGMAQESAGPPDAVEFGLRINMGRDNQFAFAPNAATTITGDDWGYAVRWNEKVLPAGASRRYVTYYGLGGSVSDFTPPYVLAEYAPFELRVITGDDPATPGTVEKFYLGDSNGSSTWSVRAYCDNFGAATLPDARATISLDSGFELDQTVGQSRTVLLGTIARNAQGSAVWKVRATPDVQPGIHEIRITGPQGKTVRRKISIPALPTLSQTGLDQNRAISMLSVPYNFQITDAEHVFQSLGSLQGSNAQLIRWDPGAQIYRSFPDDFVTNIQPGLGYWLLNRLRTSIVFPDPPDRQPIPTNQSFSVDLPAGWNQIGSPFITTIRLDQATVVGPDGVSRSILEAGTAGLIVPTFYSYDPQANDYTYPTDLVDLVMEPYVGYWLLALRPVTLVLPPPTLLAFHAPSTPLVGTAKAKDGWRVALNVRAGNVQKASRVLGASPSANDGYDLADVMSPPEALSNGPKLAAYFTHPEWGAHSGAYLTDIRSKRAGTKAWTFVVDTDLRHQDVAVSWPDLSELPDNMIATLEDLQTGRSCYMRTARSYVYNSGSGGPRQLRVTVKERSSSSLQITGFSYAPTGGGVQLSCTLSAPASVDIVIRNIAGRPIKHLWRGRDVVAGETKALWSGQSDDGLSVPSGLYVVEMNALSPGTGERTGVMRSVYYHR